MSLLSWIWDGIVAKVRALIDSATSTLRSWVSGLISGVNSALSSLQGAWNYFKTKTLPDLWAAIKNAGQTIWQTITNVYNNVTNYISNAYNYITQNVMNVTNQVTQYVTNINGATQDWVRNLLKLTVPIGFTSDPVGYVKAIADIWKDPVMQGIVKSFWKGFEEGLEE